MRTENAHTRFPRSGAHAILGDILRYLFQLVIFAKSKHQWYLNYDIYIDSTASYLDVWAFLSLIYYAFDKMYMFA